MFSKLDLVLSSSVLHSYVALNTNHTPSTLGVLTVLKISSDGFLNTPNHDRSRVHLASPPRLKYLCVCVFKREWVLLKKMGWCWERERESPEKRKNRDRILCVLELHF